MNDFIGTFEVNPGPARVIPLDNGYAIVPDPDFDPLAIVGPRRTWPFDEDGNLRDLESEGWYHLGALSE